MKKAITFFCLFFATIQLALAHVGEGYPHLPLKKWWVATENKTIEGSFLMLKGDTVFLEDAHHHTRQIPLSSLNAQDQNYIWKRHEHIERINQELLQKVTPNKSFDWIAFFKHYAFLSTILALALFFLFLQTIKKKSFSPAYLTISLICISLIFSFLPPPPQTDPAFIDAAFSPFKPKVKTRWDNRYFYVESQGIPSHQMMAGITSWQQQVPIPQCYIGTNAWSIPLNPVIAPTPVPTATNFFRGAIAIAANGVPIFNAYNNRGEDAYLIGELDYYGGHCGRADDYHYHIAPLSLDSINSAILPIAFALDGFAVYAAKEPDGNPMQSLDANHGHYYNGVYHYPGTMTYPYMIGNMVGVVTKDTTDQIIPQASASPVRPALTALRGAAITNCQANGNNNGYNLTYTLNNQNYNVNYSWTNNGIYTFNFVNPTGTTTTNYNGFRQCVLNTATQDFSLEDAISIYPNPTQGVFALNIKNNYNIFDIKSVSIYDLQGRILQQELGYRPFYQLYGIAAGVYFVKIQFSQNSITKKLIIK